VCVCVVCVCVCVCVCVVCVCVFVFVCVCVCVCVCEILLQISKTFTQIFQFLVWLVFHAFMQAGSRLKDVVDIVHFVCSHYVIV